MHGFVLLALGLLRGAYAAAKEKATEFMHQGTLWRRLWSEEQKKFYYFNVRTGQSQWTDPQRVAAGNDTFTTFMIFLLPFVLMVVAGGAYLMYIKMTHPDVFKQPKKTKKTGYVHSLAKAAKKPDAPKAT